MLRRWPLAARGDPWDRRISELAKSGKPEENDDATHRPNRWVPTSSGLPALPTDTPVSQNWYSTSVPNRIASWTYDGNGNVLNEGTVARSFTYDAENRQVTATIGSGTLKSVLSA